MKSTLRESKLKIKHYEILAAPVSLQSIYSDTDLRFHERPQFAIAAFQIFTLSRVGFQWPWIFQRR